MANGIHGRVHLDTAYDTRAQFNSDDEYADDEDEEDFSVAELESDAGPESPLDVDMSGLVDTESVRSNLAGQSLGMSEDEDILERECQFRITLSFERDGLAVDKHFSGLNISIEALDGDDDRNRLTKLKVERTVDLRYQLRRSDGSCKPTVFSEKLDLSTLGSQSNLERIIAQRQAAHRTRSILEESSQDTIYGVDAFPKRLLHIDGPSKIRVVRSLALPTRPVNYAALSYVWGKHQNMQLRKYNEPSFVAGVDIASLPSTVKDAIEATLGLGFSYLWVDALCILQDSDKDKQEELPKMASIYGNAALTIVAAVAGAAKDGFLHVQPTEDYFVAPFDLPIYDEGGKAVDWVNLSYPADYKRWRDPINDRAWTFQEFLLSRRIVVFSYRGVSFTDRSLAAVLTPENSEKSDLDWRFSVPSLTSPRFTLDVSREFVRRVWLIIRSEYSARHLTYAGDKLLAIAAVASELSKTYGKYLAGLWEEDLFLDLQWRRPDPEASDSSASSETCLQTRRIPRPTDYRAPSWSWASVDGEVADAFEDEGDDMSNRLDFRIVSCTVEPVIEGYDFGGTRSASLVVEGRMRSFIWRPAGDPLMDRCDGFLALRSEANTAEEHQFGEAMIDALEPSLVSGTEVGCLTTCAVERIPGRLGAEGLVLLPIGDDAHRRIGFFVMTSPMVFEDVLPSKITIL